MKKSSEIREEMGRQYDRVQAIIDVAQAANRELNAEETAEIDRINGSGDPKAKDYKPGVIDKLKEDLQRAENIENRERELATKRNATPPVEQDTGAVGNPTDERLNSVVIPARARYRHTGMKAFTAKAVGEGYQEKAAYLTGMFYLATIGKSQVAADWCAKQGIDTRYYGALKEGDNTLGGHLVPNETERAIINLREERGVARRESRVHPMGSDTLTIPRRTSGVTAYFVGENTEINPSDPKWDAVNLSVKKLAALVKMSKEVSEDAIISMADYVTEEIAYAFADKEDNCLFNGDGGSTYGGMTGIKNALAAGSIYTAIAGNTGFGTLDLEDFEAMVGKLPQYALQNAKWYISRFGWASSMLRLAEAAGGNTVREIAGGLAPMFLGFPVVWVQVMNSTAGAQVSTAGLAYFGDVRQGTALGSRRGMSIEVSDQRYFELDQIGIKGTERFDIVVHERGDASNAGSIIGLSTPGA